jgi:hypothetical protein
VKEKVFLSIPSKEARGETREEEEEKRENF